MILHCPSLAKARAPFYSRLTKLPGRAQFDGLEYTSESGHVQLEIVNRMCGISLIVSGFQLHCSSSDHINGFQDAAFGSLLQTEKWASEAFYPTMDDLKEVIKRRGPDHVGIEKVQLKVFNEHEPACREEQTLIREEKPHLLEEVSYKSFPMEKLEIFMQETDGSEIQTVYTEKIKKESNCQEHINNCLDCSGNTLQALKNCIVANFVEEVNGQSLDGFQENTFAEMLFLSATLQLRGVHPLFQPLRDSWTNIMEDEERIVKCAPIAILFSGGLDSMILAALLDQCLTLNCEIDLLNVSFDGPHAPDRISAKAGVIELQRIAPLRRWRLVEIDADPSNLQPETKYLTSIIHPAKTYMDLNIGTALWLAACGEGWVEEDELLQGEDDCCLYESHSLSTRHEIFKRKKYRSEAKILLVGSGADEQCAGYGRHRTKFRLGGWAALQEEMKIDIQRIWKRNLGRDDRCLADHGKEARFPFLDEDVISTLLDIPLWEIADLEKPAGQGDKKILRQVARLMGLDGASMIPKRAIQFGSRIARESNRRNFGSNRAANQASAGSTVIHCLRE